MQPQPQIQQSAQVPPPAGQQPPPPYPYPPYYVPPPRSDSSKIVMIIVVVVVVVVIISAVVAAVLYVMVSGLMTGPGTGPHVMGLSVSQTADGSNWSAVVTTTTANELPATTYVLIRNNQGVIVLQRTSFSSLTQQTWSTHHVLYLDANPSSPSIAASDSLIISRTTYPSGSLLEVSDDLGTLTSRTLA